MTINENTTKEELAQLIKMGREMHETHCQNLKGSNQ